MIAFAAGAEYEAAILEDLDWLGFEADEGRRPVTRQSDTPEIYRDALNELKRDASRLRVRLLADRHRRRALRRALPRPRTQRRFRARRAHAARRRRPCAVTICWPARSNRHRRSSAATSCSGIATATGPISSRSPLTTCVRASRWSFEAPTCCHRPDGRSCWRGCSAARLPRIFLHHPLIMGPHGEKLSKSAGDTGVRELRAQGFGPEEVIGRAAAAIGLIDSPRPIPASEVVRPCFL